jgi:hypothetical protein
MKILKILAVACSLLPVTVTASQQTVQAARTFNYQIDRIEACEPAAIVEEPVCTPFCGLTETKDALNRLRSRFVTALHERSAALQERTAALKRSWQTRVISPCQPVVTPCEPVQPACEPSLPATPACEPTIRPLIRGRLQIFTKRQVEATPCEPTIPAREPAK